mgnify:FL=1
MSSDDGWNPVPVVAVASGGMATSERSEALFTVLDDGRLRANDLARGPWDPDALHGGPVAALAARALEQALADPGFTGRPARFVLELERPFGFDPVTVTAEVTRPGRSVRSAAAEVHDDRGRRLARATLLSIRTTDLDVTGAVRPDDEPPPPRPAHADPPSPWAAGGGRAFHRDAVEHAFVEGGFEALGPAVDWIRLVVPVVVGEDPSPLQRVVAAADFGNGISAAVTHAEHLFINPDLVVSLERLPVGIDVGLAAATRVDRGGIGLAEAVLWDEHGRIGHSSQTLLVQRRT